MALNLPTFYKRSGSAIVFAIVMMAGLLWNEWAFMALVSLVAVLCLRDYFRLMCKINGNAACPRPVALLAHITGIALLWLLFLSHQYSYMPLWPVLLCIPIFILLITAIPANSSLQAGLQVLGGLLYISLPMVLLLQLRLISIMVPVALILMIWMNDTMAYLVGSFIGKTPFSEISPKKTWEGTAGGAILTIMGAAIWGHFTHYYNMIDWMALALCAAVAGTAGDLLESKLKRMADVKDSGTLMPGHGGALDRFDSLLVATPFAFCYAYFFMPPVKLVIF